MEGYCILYTDYFADNPLHSEAVFRHRFRMSRKLFLKIVYALQDSTMHQLLQDDLVEHI
jgi:hypothetical protein